MSETFFLNLYEEIGGEPTLRKLVDNFYDLVKDEPLLSPLFPDDFTSIKQKQFMFLSQFFGGPALYSQAFGHPMMRARHLPFAITPSRAAAWLSCMDQALTKTGIEGDLKKAMMERFTLTAYHMVNTPE